MSTPLAIPKAPLILVAMLQAACTAEVVATGNPVQRARSELERMVRDQELPGAQYVALRADDMLLDATPRIGLATVLLANRT